MSLHLINCHGLGLKWHPFPHIVHYFCAEPYGPWSKGVYYIDPIGNMMPFRMSPWISNRCKSPFHHSGAVVSLQPTGSVGSTGFCRRLEILKRKCLFTHLKTLFNRLQCHCFFLSLLILVIAISICHSLDEMEYKTSMLLSTSVL